MHDMTSEVTDLGPQYAGDSPFQARMRFHQSWYRARVLGLPCGTGPRAQDRSHYGNMLRWADGEQGRNFLTPGIFETAARRLQEGVGVIEPFRLLCNMLSSQPMCFNLFAPLAEDADLATRLLAAVIGGNEVRQVAEVRLEYAPEPRSEYLNDGTAFDAFVEYVRSDGRRAFLGIETKLSEQFSPGAYHKPAYDRWVSGADSPFLPEGRSCLDDARHNQLWRDHLLAIAMRDHRRSPYASGALALVRHPWDEGCEATVAGYRSLLRRGDRSFIDLPLDRLVGAWEPAAPDDDTRAWLAAFRLRYVDLAASEEEWRRRHG